MADTMSGRMSEASGTVGVTEEPRGSAADPGEATRQASRIDHLFVAGVVAVCVVLRFVTTSPLWLDEALSVNIASLPVGDIFEALRQDGHPPLYYVLLHYWMELVGEGDAAIRSLSGLFSVATLPLAWIAGARRWGRSGALAVLLVTAVTPFSLRYATEARMYSLVPLLALAAWLVADDLRRRPDRRRWVALAVLTGLLLLTHYWALYLGVASVGLLAWRWWRHGARAEAIRLGSALAAGGLLFVPWLPSFAYQAANTGTPWGTAGRPTRAVIELAGGLGGGFHFPEGLLFGFLVAALTLLGLFVAAVDDWRTTLDLRTTAIVRAEVAIVVATMGVGVVAGLASNSTFIVRYAAVVVPMLFVAAGVGLARLPAPWPRRVVAVSLVVLAGPGAFVNVDEARTQGEAVADAIEAGGGPGDLVVFCPDQLGPSTLRTLDERFEAVAVPSLERPDRIDWVDYQDRNESVDPAAVAADLLALAEGRTIWLVYSTSYRTYEDLCPGVISGLIQARSADLVLAPDPVFEPATLSRFDP